MLAIQLQIRGLYYYLTSPRQGLKVGLGEARGHGDIPQLRLWGPCPLLSRAPQKVNCGHVFPSHQ